MKVGISILAVRGVHILGSGHNQNIAFLAQLLRHCPGVDEVFLINGGDCEELPQGMEEAVAGFPLVRPHDVTHTVDVVIEVGAQLPVEWMCRVKARGGKLVLFLLGPAYVDAIENPIFGRTAGVTFTGTPWDEIWMLPSHIATSAAMMRTVTRAPVHPMPHLWSPLFVERQVQALQPGSARFGFAPPGGPGDRARGWRVAIFEPNISVVKTAFIPLLICESAYRTDPAAVELVAAMNTFHMKEHPTFNALAVHLDLTRDHRSYFEPRLPFVDCMVSNRLDAVVTHQWECSLNYLYYDALHGGYPLVHNSEPLRNAGVGLYYTGFAAVEGGQVLLGARQQDPTFWHDYRRNAHGFLATLAPDHPANIRAFAERLDRGR